MLHLILALVVLAGSIHSPALAHDIYDHAGEEQHRLADDYTHHSEDAWSEDDEDRQIIPIGLGAELGHHHHCPLGLPSNDTAIVSDKRIRADLPAVGIASALASRACAPLLEPPVA